MGRVDRIVSYEELKGSSGRRIFYRPERYPADRLFGRLPAVAEIGGSVHPLVDLSLSGISVAASPLEETPFRPGDDVPVRLRFGERTFFDGRGRVCRVELDSLRPKVAIHLTQGVVDIPGSIGLSRELALSEALQTGIGSGRGQVSPEYRALIADTTHFLRQLRRILSEHLDDAEGQDQRDAAVAACERGILQEWRNLWHRANELVEPLEHRPEAKLAAKRFTESVLTPEFMDGAIWRRSYEKPLGYPGDFEVMNYVYRWRPEGQTSFARLVHRLGLEVGEFIASRMVGIQQSIARELNAKPGGEPLSVVNLGAGPAQEVANTLKMPKLARRVDFALVDQDLSALSYAYAQAYPQALRSAGAATLRCLHVSFTELLRSGTLFKRLGQADMIYSIGLLDYLTQRRAKRLVCDLFEQLKPGGLLVVANMRKWPGSIMWPLEYVADWSLVYRTENEMRDLAEGLGPASVEITTDETKQAYFLNVRRL